MLTLPPCHQRPPKRREMEKDYWSQDGQIFFTGGQGFGLKANLETICLGTEADINEVLETGKLTDKFNVSQRVILADILEYRKEEGIGTRKSNMVGAVNIRVAGHRQEATRSFAPRERLPLRAPRTKHKALSRR